MTPRQPHGVLSDAGCLALAGAASAGAVAAVGPPLVISIALLVAGVWLRRPAMVVVAAALVVGGHAATATSSTTLVPSGEVSVSVRVDSDPVRISHGTRLDGSADGRHFEMVGFGSSGAKLRELLVGQTVAVTATQRPVVADSWADRRGIDASLAVSEVHNTSPASGAFRLANQFRELLESGSASMAVDDQALFLGVVYGDDRNLSELVQADFRAAGLTHLVAVSGQNVAFVLLVAGPGLRRLRPASRWICVLLLLVLFATITRFEPSVMRATAMAAIAATATVMGREATATRTLSLAIAGLLALDPGLVHQLAFRLSVAATAGILWLSPRIASRMVGPRWLREAVAVTAGAQLAVAPLLVATFGSVPVAALPANVLAGPASAPLMAWGLTGGLVSGVSPAWLAEILHWPTAALTGWLRAVARFCAQVPLGEMGALDLVGGAVLVAIAELGRHHRAAVAAAVAVLLVPSLGFFAADRGRYQIHDGLTVWRAPEWLVVEIGDSGSNQNLLAELRRAGVGDIDLIVLTTGSDRERAKAALVRQRHRVGATWSPDTLAMSGATSLNGLSLTVETSSGVPTVEVSESVAPP